ncbi:hypothetical protein NE237_009010 [Protea cynaroides]|uniref:Reverse transcriptase Ty1/copia-type domain-containing protein n=1 Tax=Protea cynaroides TaxID=273540 RepID=A0A9Q0KWX1_9MAGN|nr:hypothetical protein NE237_009010 [Protea cynaroides]
MVETEVEPVVQTVVPYTTENTKYVVAAPLSIVTESKVEPAVEIEATLSGNGGMFSSSAFEDVTILQDATVQAHSGSNATIQTHAGSNATDPNIISQVNFLHTGSDSLGTAHSDSIPSGVRNQSRADLLAVKDDVGVLRSIKEALTHPSWKAAMDIDGVLSTPVYMSRPTGYVDVEQPQAICKLKRALYGLNQVPHAWFDRFSCYLLEFGFTYQHFYKTSSL